MGRHFGISESGVCQAGRRVRHLTVNPSPMAGCHIEVRSGGQVIVGHMADGFLATDVKTSVSA